METRGASRYPTYFRPASTNQVVGAMLEYRLQVDAVQMPEGRALRVSCIIFAGVLPVVLIVNFDSA